MNERVSKTKRDEEEPGDTPLRRVGATTVRGLDGWCRRVVLPLGRL